MINKNTLGCEDVFAEIYEEFLEGKNITVKTLNGKINDRGLYANPGSTGKVLDMNVYTIKGPNMDTNPLSGKDFQTNIDIYELKVEWISGATPITRIYNTNDHTGKLLDDLIVEEIIEKKAKHPIIPFPGTQLEFPF